MRTVIGIAHEKTPDPETGRSVFEPDLARMAKPGMRMRRAYAFVNSG